VIRDLKKLQGVWTVVSVEVDGHQAEPGGSSIQIEGDRFTSSGMGAVYKGGFSVDASAKPKAFDLKFTAGPEKGNVNRGIYELKGATWRMCLATRGSKRPQDFASPAGSGFAVQTLKRGVAQAAVAVPFEDVRTEPVPELEGEWRMIAGAMSGEPFEKSLVKSGKRVVHGGETSVYFGPNLYATAKVTVDRSQAPPAMDYYHIKGTLAGKIQHGIYELKGSSLRLCFSAAGKPRPSEFSSARGDGRTFTEWKRA
jgi:uncharacterized protein (TIGR03067 family)